MSKDNMSLEEYLEFFSEATSKQLMPLILEDEKKYGKEVGSKLIVSLVMTFLLMPEVDVNTRLDVLTSLVCNLVLRNLKENETATTSEDEKIKAVKDFKFDIQNSISYGFQVAFSQFLGRDAEYFCEIYPVPEAINKEPC